jgi:uncharacterized OB-fold protein
MTERPPRLLPNPTGPSAELYAFWARGELRLQRCAACGEWRHPPRYRCASCGSDAVTWDLASGRARVFSWTITHRSVDPAFVPPYAIVVAELDEGPRLVGSLAGIANDELRLDLPVVVALEPASETVALVTFAPG